MYKNYIKRLVDICISIVLLPFFIVLFVIIGFLIKKEDKGPIFYTSNRIGKDFEIFKMIKFRTMKVDAPTILNKDGSTFNSENDTRVTKIGKILRENSLDEIPQLLNIIKGDMSFIGPRPSMEIAKDTFEKDEAPKMKVRPGITGFTQAFYRNNITNRGKRLKDAWYAENITFLLDFKILLKTIKTVIKKDNIYTDSN